MSEVEKLKQRFKDAGVTGFHFSWGPEAANLSNEELAECINKVQDECDHPVRGLAAELAGEAFLYEDKASAILMQHKIEDGRLVPVEPSRADVVEARRAERMYKLLTNAANMLRKLQDQLDSIEEQLK